jgi:hypothetical protein
MTKFRWRTWLGAFAWGVVAALPVQATPVDFEDVTPTLFSGTAVSSGAFDFTSSASFGGFSGVDSSAAFSGNAPPNATGQFLFMLNADGMHMQRTDGGAFFLPAFDAAFIAPLGGSGGSASPGELHVSAQQIDGDPVNETFLFSGADLAGNYNFTHFLASALAAEALKFADFSACIYLPDNSCSFDPLAQDIPPQFALDDIAVVPEPTTAALALASLCIIALRRRRQTV